MIDPTWQVGSAKATVRVVLAGDTATVPAHVLTPAQLRTVAMPNLRSPDARTLDAHACGLDCRTADDKLVAELVRLVDVVQVLRLEVDELKRTQAVTIAGLEAYIRDHSEADVPFAMAEDAWGVE